MSEILYGVPVAQALREDLRGRIAALKARSVEPCLALVRVGEDPGSLSYERATLRACEKLGITVRPFRYPEGCTTQTLAETLRAISADGAIHGCLLLRPLPEGVDEQAASEAISPEKDVDGVTGQSLRRVFVGYGPGHCPCTPEAVLALLDFYQISLDGARVTIVGRSLVVGRPLTLLLTGRNATVTLCHTHTRDLAARCREADVLIVAAGCAGLIGPEHVRPGQTVVDVGTTPDAEGRLRGDAQFDAVEPLVGAISPVPGGVGAITTTLLLEHVVTAAENPGRR